MSSVIAKIKFLEKILEKTPTENENLIYRNMASLLLLAMNDWPGNNINDVNNFLFEIKSFLNGEITAQNIKNKNTFENIKLNSWKLESLSSISELINLSKSNFHITDLESIINFLYKHYNIK